MPPRAAVQTTLDAAFGVRPKRGVAEVIAASGSTPAKKRRKVSERYLPCGVHSSTDIDSYDASVARR